jgi:hypothetical protein
MRQGNERKAHSSRAHFNWFFFLSYSSELSETGRRAGRVMRRCDIIVIL